MKVKAIIYTCVMYLALFLIKSEENNTNTTIDNTNNSNNTTTELELLEAKKKKAIADEDFEAAKLLKIEIERIKIENERIKNAVTTTNTTNTDTNTTNTTNTEINTNTTTSNATNSKTSEHKLTLVPVSEDNSTVIQTNKNQQDSGWGNYSTDEHHNYEHDTHIEIAKHDPEKEKEIEKLEKEKLEKERLEKEKEEKKDKEEREKHEKEIKDYQNEVENDKKKKKKKDKKEKKDKKAKKEEKIKTHKDILDEEKKKEEDLKKKEEDHEKLVSDIKSGKAKLEDQDHIYDEEELLHKDAEIINSQKTEEKKNKKKSRKEEEEEIIRKEWENEISNFHPSDLLTVKCPGKDREFFYQKISVVPSEVKIAHFVNDENTKINFVIKDPRGNEIYQKNKAVQVFHSFIANTTGVYEFTLENPKKRTASITFAIHTGDNTDSHLEVKHLDDLYTKIKSTSKKCNEIKVTSGLLTKKKSEHFHITKSHNNNIAIFSVIETGVMIFIFIIQLIYIKSLISK